MEEKLIVKGWIHSFLWEIGRVSKTHGFHYEVMEDDFGNFIIKHHNNRWVVKTTNDFREIVIEDAENRTERIVVKGEEIMVGGGRIVREICAWGYRCHAAEEIRRKVAAAVLAFYSNLPKPVLVKAMEAILLEPP
jgi:hypothetical protein